MSDLESKISALPPDKRELLERKLRDKEKRQETEPIQPRPSASAPPLSFGQQRLWFLDQWEPGNSAYNISRPVQIEGPLDIAALERSLSEISRRHETLRTTFSGEGDTPTQIIHPPQPTAVRVLDLSAFEGEAQEAEAFRLAHEEAARPFDLAKGPMLRATVLRLEQQKHLLILSIHHIASDGWSMTVLYRELFTLYEGFTEGHPSTLPELPIQYADFAAWQRRRLQGERLAKQLSYWREQLRDLATLALPTDRPRPPVQMFTGASYRIHLPPTLLDGLNSTSRKHGATLFMTLLAAFQALLHRYCGQDDIVVGTPIAGRTRVEVEGLIGFFVNMLVLRADASGDPTFLEFLARVERVALQAYDHQEISFEKLVEEIHPPRDSSRNPLFQVAFALQNVTRPFPALKRIKVTRFNISRSLIRFDLEVHLQEIEQGLEALFIYNTALFEAETIGRMAGHFRTMLEAVVADPGRRLSVLPLLTEAERHRFLAESNDTATDYPRNACIHEIFEAQAETTPDALAVAYAAEELTYRQLNERSNRLAHHLRTLGIGPDVPVAICLERSVQMIVGFLGILKAGGAYLPLEPSYPRERLAFMLDDANVGVLLTEEKVLAGLPETRARVVCLDREHLDDASAENPNPETEATSLAYIMYTSGSTGKPKGVSLPHRAVVRLVINTNYVDLSPADRVAQASNASFDAATFEIWGSLLNGASLIGVPKTVLLSPREFAREILERKITTLFLTTALFNQIASETPAAFQTLRYLLVGGQVCDAKWVREILRHGPPQHLLNVYGPTESTTFATWHPVESVDELSTTIPIGRPISNTRVYLLDRYGQPVPAGVIGEVFIGGDGLAREYLNRPDLTSEKFQRDPFNVDPSARLYRTGDFARYRPDASIDFVGRVDQQVKIRGFRIELQEIEATLARHPQVSKSFITARQNGQSEQRLVAYLVPAGGARPSQEDLRRFLREKLPDYMVPSAFVLLDSLPLTPNGKIDDTALPDPGHRVDHTLDFAEPRTPIQQEIARIWQELLGLDRVGIRDNFFDLGGHSLLAIQLIARIERKFGKTVPVGALFGSPTIDQLSRLLGDEKMTDSWSSLLLLQTEGSRLPFFWVHGDWSNALLPAYLGTDQPLYGLEHQAEDGRPALHVGIDTIAKYYLEQVRTIRPHGPYLLGGYSFGAVAAFEMAQQLRNEGEEVALLFMLDPTGQRIEHQPRVTRTGVRGHMRNLARLGFGERVGYLQTRIRGIVDSKITGPIARPLKKLRWKTRLSTGGLLPPSLRSAYIIDVYRKALRSYVPRPYPGPVTLFKLQDCTYLPPMDWMSVITGELDVHEGPGDHMDLTKEPYVALWAERLKTALGRAQQRTDW